MPSVRFFQMRTNKVRQLSSALRVALVLFLALLVAGPALAAGYPRRIAVAPFESLAREDIGSTVAVLPRLVASRLMALAGADVLLLPAGGKSPMEAAREAKYPLLLQGTVSKLGKGFSIDAVVTDLAEGKNAGAFFAAAATEDEIISRLGILSGEIAEKVFGVQGAVRSVSPAPVAVVPAGVPQALPPAAISGSAGVAAVGPARQAAATSAPAAVTLSGGWVPSTIKKVGQSDKIADELFGVVALGREADGTELVAAYGRNVLHLYRVKGKELLPYTRIRRPSDNHILSVDALDLDGDGGKEILVTNLIEESVQSFILKKKGDAYEETAGRIRYYLAVLPDWNGKPTLVGQYQGIITPFEGKIVPLIWDGKGLSHGEPFPHDTTITPLVSGVLGISSARFDKESRLIYTDTDANLRVLDGDGKTRYKSRSQYGSGLDYFEWGPIIEMEGRRKWFPLRMAARLSPGSGGSPLVLMTEVRKGILDLVGGSYDSTRIVLLRWEGEEFVEKAGTQGTGSFISGADFLTTSDFRKGGGFVASVIETTGVILRDKVSRLYLYEVE